MVSCIHSGKLLARVATAGPPHTGLPNTVLASLLPEEEILHGENKRVSNDNAQCAHRTLALLYDLLL